jgi:hypothetical protein
LNPQFENYRLIYDNAEDGALMDLARYFGAAVAQRLEPPKTKDGVDIFSETTEAFYYNVNDALEGDQPFIYVLDSMDALQTLEDIEKFGEQKKAWEDGKETTGTYGMAKAKQNSTQIRGVVSGLRRTGSILVIISQTRDNIGFGFEKKTRAGGRALKFYATLEIWTSVTGQISKTVRKKKRQQGITAQVHIKKNRVSGKDRKVEVPIFHSYGIDDVGSCVDYLLEEEHWQKRGQKVSAGDLDFVGTRDALIAHIEQNGLEDEVRDITGTVWREIEEACAVKRKKRYL